MPRFPAARAASPAYILAIETAARASGAFSSRAQPAEYDSSMGFSRHSLQFLGAFEMSQVRSSSRNVDSSAVRFKSMNKTPYICAGPRALYFYVSSEPLVTCVGPAPESLVGVAKSGRIVSWPCQYFLRRSFFKILPVAVLGKLSTNSN